MSTKWVSALLFSVVLSLWWFFIGLLYVGMTGHDGVREHVIFSAPFFLLSFGMGLWMTVEIGQEVWRQWRRRP